jgi:hypothetical protein
MNYYGILHNAEQGHTVMLRAWEAAKPWLIAGHKLELRITQETRTVEQNSAQWPILQAFSEQLRWPVDAEMVKMTEEEWKDVLTAAFKGETIRLAKGLNGGVVMLGLRTSKFSKKQFSEYLEFLHATAALKGVDLGQDMHEMRDSKTA